MRQRLSRLCLSSFMAAEYENLLKEALGEVKAFTQTNVEWLGQVLANAGLGTKEFCGRRAWAIYAAVAGV